MKKTIWVIEEGSYSDYHVVGVFSSKENAMVVYNYILQGSSDMKEPSEWVLDPNVDELLKGFSPFQVLILRDGAVEYCSRSQLSTYNLGTSVSLWERTKAPAYKGKNIPDVLRVSIMARDEKHAIKIANEKRAQMIANGEWK